MKIVGVAGTKNTGKTTLVTKIVQELTNRGYHVTTIKHTHHDFDLEGKDTWKHREAGAELVVGSGENTFFLMKGKMELDKIINIVEKIKDPDYIVIEGLKHSNYSKISTTEAKNDFTITNVNVFDLKERDIESLVDLIEERSYGIIPYADCGECGFDNCLEMAQAIVKGEASEASCKMRKLMEVKLFIGDERVPLNPFVQDFIKNTVMGMVKTLKINDDVDIHKENVELLIRNG
jgi:molybdopterin-guanine dinucleotide biosynthesis protein B